MPSSKDRNSRSFLPRIDLEDISEEVQENRFTDLKPEKDSTWTTRLISIFAKKAVLFPLLAVLLSAGIYAGWYYFLRPNEGKEIIDGTEKKDFDRKNFPELPADNKDLNEGKAYFLKGWYPAAQSAFERVLNSDAPDEQKGIALTFMGMIAYDQEQYLRAIDFFQRANKYKKDDPLILRNLAMAYRKRGQNDLAIDSIQKAIQLESKDSYNYVILGNIYFELGDFSRSLEAYKKGLEKSPDDPMLHFNAALASLKLGDDPAAINFFHLAARKAKLGKIASDAYLNLGKIYAARQDWEKAEEYFSSAHKLLPKDSNILYQLGNVKLAQGKKEEALALFEQALSLENTNPELFENLGDAFLKYDMFKEGMDAYSKAIRANPKSQIQIRLKMAQLYAKSGDLKSAEENYRKIIALSPGSNDARIAYIELGNLLDSVKKYEEAVEMYRKASELDPSEEKAWINMALTYQKMNQFVQSRQAFKKAIQINPENLKPRLGLARLFQEQGFHNEAISEYLQILQMNADYSPAHFHIAQIYQMKNQFAEAKSGYEKVLSLKESKYSSNEIIYKSHLNLALVLSEINKKGKGAENTPDLYQKSISHAKTALQMHADLGEAYYVLGNIYLSRGEMGDMENAADIFRQAISLPNINSEILSRSHNGLGKAFFYMKKYPLAIREFSEAIKIWPANEEAALNRKSAVLKYEESLN